MRSHPQKHKHNIAQPVRKCRKRRCSDHCTALCIPRSTGTGMCKRIRGLFDTCSQRQEAAPREALGAVTPHALHWCTYTTKASIAMREADDVSGREDVTIRRRLAGPSLHCQGPSGYGLALCKWQLG